MDGLVAVYRIGYQRNVSSIIPFVLRAVLNGQRFLLPSANRHRRRTRLEQRRPTRHVRNGQCLVTDVADRHLFLIGAADGHIAKIKLRHTQ